MDEQTRSLLGTVAILRAALMVWASVVIAIDMSGTTEVRAAIAVVALVALALWSGGFAFGVYRCPRVVTTIPVVCFDVAVAATAAALDPVVYPGPHPQSFASAWPLSSAVIVGVTFGARSGAFAGLFIGSVGAGSVAAFAERGLQGRLLGAMGTIVLLVVGGWLAGLVSERLRRAELTQARAEVREEVSRRLHDGVLQTLAVIQRRSGDEELVELARDQESELRSFIAGPEPEASVLMETLASLRSTTTAAAPPLSSLLRQALRSLEKKHRIRCELVVVDEPPILEGRLGDALVGAVCEAVTNAAKHGGVETVRVFVDAEDGVIVAEVTDSGSGFDPGRVVEGIGMSRSIRGRIEQVGGTVTFRSATGRGTTVAIAIPT